MELVLQILIGIIVAFHLYVVWLEMFAWTTRAPGVFTNFPKELFPQTKALAANQGLYNGFLAAGLTWSFFIENPAWKLNVSLFFLICVAVAGIYGALTASKKIFFVQALPALIAIGVLVVMPKKCDTGRCIGERTQESEIRGYYIGNHGYTSNAVLTLEELKRKELKAFKSNGMSHDKDSIIDTIRFEYKNRGHEIVLFTNLPHAPVDGEMFYAKMDNIGSIYYHALSWRNVSYLQTTSDSLNSIISVALAKIAANRTEAEQELITMKYYPIKPLAFVN